MLSELISPRKSSIYVFFDIILLYDLLYTLNLLDIQCFYGLLIMYYTSHSHPLTLGTRLHDEIVYQPHRDLSIAQTAVFSRLGFLKRSHLDCSAQDGAARGINNV